jgi:hypothetical protein
MNMPTKILTIISFWFVGAAYPFDKPIVDKARSLELASTDSFRKLAPKINAVWIYCIDPPMDLHKPLDYSHALPTAVLKGDEVGGFIRALGTMGDRGRVVVNSRTNTYYACFVFFDAQTSKLPAYLWCSVFVDGRSYVNCYSGADSVGCYNGNLASFLSVKTEGRAERVGPKINVFK